MNSDLLAFFLFFFFFLQLAKLIGLKLKTLGAVQRRWL